MQPLVFTQNRSNGWKCLICPNSKYTVLSQAVIHEDRQTHVARVRNLDREAAPMSSPLRATQGADSDSESGSTPSGTPSPPNCDPIDEDYDLFAGIPSFTGIPSVHGPALPSDDPNQIYDDFSGELARNRPSPEYYDSDSDDDNYSDDLREPASDATMDLPESDGLLGQYDDRFAEEQRCTFRIFDPKPCN